MEQENQQLEDLPQSLIDELRALDKPATLITSRVDRELANLAENQFSVRRRPSWTRGPAWGAIAATVLLAILIAQFSGTRLLQPGADDSTYADVDGSGRVDIADVLALARDKERDQITQAEIDAFAQRIVSLGSGSDAS